jgi:superfamily II DNA/RNA helicase
LPVIMSGRDCIGVAKTGSGKTASYLLPCFRHCADQPPMEQGDGPIALVFTPARELCVQVFQQAKHFFKHAGVSGCAVYGGAPVADQIAELKKGPQIVICTPGRMIDMLCANAGKVTNLKRVTYLTIDEADRMFDLGFEPQITKVLENTRPDRQTVFFSATFPKQMEALARKHLRHPIEMVVGGRSVVSNTIEHFVELREPHERFFRLLELLVRRPSMRTEGCWRDAHRRVLASGIFALQSRPIPLFLQLVLSRAMSVLCLTPHHECAPSRACSASRLTSHVSRQRPRAGPVASPHLGRANGWSRGRS